MLFLPLIFSLFIVNTSDIFFFEHPCSDNIHVQANVTQPDCYGNDGQITFSNPDPSTATFQWSHDATETGYNVGNLDAGTYEVTITVGDHIRVVTFVLQ